MNARPKVLLVGGSNGDAANVPDALFESFEVVSVDSPLVALERLAKDRDLAGLFVVKSPGDEALQLERLLENDRILEGMPDGVALLDAENTVLWANQTFRKWSTSERVTGQNFYSTLGSPEILGPDFCPFHTTLAMRQPSSSTLRVDENRYFHIHAAPIHDGPKLPQYLIVSISDVTTEQLQQQKLAAIHKAGVELADLSPEEVFNMEIDDRIELLKSNILFYTRDLLKFNVVEVRLLDQESGLLEPLLSYGIDAEAANRDLYARTQDNGVTGFVAATGKGYLCEDTLEDPLYIQGLAGARSSLTVPLIWHDQVIGTFNVESPNPRAFSESDLQFLEIFSRDVAVSLNTLELLVAQKANTAKESVEAIHSAVALPIDEILNDAVGVMECYIGHEPEVVEKLQRILRHARNIKTVIHKVGQKMAPARAVPPGVQIDERPRLRGRRILVVDADASVRIHAHDLLERYGCTVETAHDGLEAVSMVRTCQDEGRYDIVIADIRLSDMTGYDLMMKLKETMGEVPMVLMTGFGYDPEHTIVKARKAGLLANAVLFKPFRLDQLLTTVESMLDHCERRDD